MSFVKSLRHSITSSEAPDLEDPLDVACGLEIGCGSCRSKRFPAKICQCFATSRWALVFFSLGGIMQGFIVNGNIPVITSTLERRFELTSTEAGFIATSYDIAGSVAILFVTYLGGNGHKPLWVGWGIFFIGLAGILFSFPRFIAPYYEFGDDINVCGDASSQICVISTLRTFRFWFYGAMVIAGLASSPLYSLSITYLDENVKQRYSSLYNGIFIAFSIVGPGAGFLVGAAFLKQYTYIGETVSIDRSSELWVGAWWIGTLICGIVGVAITVPVLMLPRVLPGTAGLRLNREKETHQSSKKDSDVEKFGEKFRDFPRCVFILIQNPTFLFISLGVSIDSILLGGISTFGPKYIETQFGIDASTAGTYFGLMAILGGAGGQLIGGGAIAKLNFSVKQMLHMSYIAPFLAAIASCCYLITCSNPQFAGVTTPYSGSNQTDPTIDDSCNSVCGCSGEVYSPVCGNDGLTYFSPCFAGCYNQTGEIFSNCTCVTTINGSVSLNQSESGTAMLGTCPDSRCKSGWQLIVFCCLNFFLMFFTFSNDASGLQASIRCVAFNQRSFAIGLQILLSRVIGTGPGPVIMGAIFDSACLQWTEECGVRGSCLAYNNTTLALYTTLLLVILKLIVSVTFLMALLLYKPVPEQSAPINESHSNDHNKESTKQEETNGTKADSSYLAQSPSVQGRGTLMSSKHEDQNKESTKQEETNGTRADSSSLAQSSSVQG